MDDRRLQAAASLVVGALHALSNPPHAFTRLCSLGSSAEGQPVAPTAVPQSSARRLECSEIEAIVRAYQSGHSVSRIAKDFGIHRSTFYVRLAQAGVELRTREALTPAQVRQAESLYRQGRSLADVGLALGVDAQTVRNHLAKAGVTIRKRRGWS